MKCFNDYIVNENVLKNNAKNIRACIGESVKFCAVVKANAYGIGLETVCKALYGYADFFACACLKEALSIRVFDKTTPILILGYIDNKDLELVSKNNISISVGDFDQLLDMIKNIKSKINVHIQINTGLNRFGFRSLKEFKKVLRMIGNESNINLEGVYSHFATKGNDIVFVNKQYFRFLQFKKLVQKKDVIFHIANSFATCHNKIYHLGMVRCGMLLYGHVDNSLKNESVLKIKSHVIKVSNVRKGDKVGYDRTYTATRSMKIAIIPIGYADGFDRKLSNNFNVIINGIYCKVVGLVCMDVIMVDVTDVDVKCGDSVVILGGDNEVKVGLSDYANTLQASPYEVLCNFSYKRMNYVVLNNKNT